MPKNKLKIKVDIKKIYTDWRYFIGYGFGTGLLPKIPGTWGTLIAIPLVWLLSFCSIFTNIAFLVIYFFLGVYVSDKISHEIGIHDFGGVNCDEVFGFSLVMLPFSISIQNFFIAFILFRFFDILKPYPVSWIDKNIKGGLGMMLDDLAAAIMSICTMYVILMGINFYK